MNEWRSQLRILRHYHGLKQAVLAEMMNVDQATVSRWERNRQTPDLSGQKRLRDLLYKFSTRMDVEVKAVLSSPLVDRSLIDTDYVIRGVSRASLKKLKINEDEMLGRNVNSLRNDPAYEKLVEVYKGPISKGEFTSIKGLFFSQACQSWVETYTIPVLVSGKLHLLNDRKLISASEPLTPSLEIDLIE